jgi:lysophospholipase-3
LPPTAEGSELYDNIKTLIETTYASNGNTPVHVVSHSMGGPLFLYFLNQMTQAWKDQYIQTFIPIAGPWAGSPKALRGLISGDNLGIEVFSLLFLNDLIIL